jgi:hypothetical protein
LSRSLLLLLLLCALTRLAWIFILPSAEAPDENTHLWVINFLRENFRLPTGAEVLAGGPAAVYGSLPQLGYLPHVLVTMLVPDQLVPLYARFGSLLSGLVTVWAGFKIAAELFAGQRLLTLALPLLLTFHPQLVFVHSYSNNDATASAVASVLIYLLVKMVNSGLSIRLAFAAGILATWLALSKYSGWTVLPAAGCAFVFATVIHRPDWRVTLTCFALPAAVFLTTVGGWLWRNSHEFSGDLLGTKTMYHTWAVAFNKQLVYHISPWQILGSKRWWRFFYFSYWAMFGYTSRSIWRPLYFVFLGFHSVALYGWLKLALRSRGERTDQRRLAVWLLLALCLIFNLAGMVYASTENLGGPQGRYLFVSEVPVFALSLQGLSAAGPKAGRKLVIGLVAFTALVCLGAWIMLFRIYGFHAQP